MTHSEIVKQQKELKQLARELAFKKQATSQIGNLGAMLGFFSKLGEEHLGKELTQTLKAESKKAVQFKQNNDIMEIKDFLVEAKHMLYLVKDAIEKVKENK